eukprot:CAMPEP_0172530606 /NCGR_PEP_ID=MMETSP1067-20121228/4291_1 /TAXON_ID=265564 ORGANISM="Thalassiosira punctigera, Strain Tpunct2005C2" /NCGR_SAMPLE_ID=MMETSP1067 /ASSEMBLY_ACC=CAM_ASM_000444 /LENGTH=509 /DNA_ID=CAMNT_0013314849 /DNA_START=188 /DNA_END=1717 /DNA_ORIENTATION=-
MDSIMGAVVGPTLIFYVIQLGGTKEHYGMMQSTGMLAAMLTIPMYGSWVDSNGNKYTTPYMCSFFLGVISNMMYFLAVLLPKGPIAIYTVMFSRFITGAAGSGRTLSYSWVASSIPPDKQRTIITLLSMSRTFGMIAGPLTNYLVSEINTEWKVLGFEIPLDPNNSIGLIMVGGELILALITFLFFNEPPAKEEKLDKIAKADASGSTKESKGVLYALSHFDILFPIFTIFVVMCNFMLLGTAFSPVARNMGWNSVSISEVSAWGSLVMASGMVISMVVSMRDVSDFAMIVFGFGNFFVGGWCIYDWWKEEVGYWRFTIPMYILYFAYPFIGPANRSKYTRAIYDNKEFEGSHGVILSLVNQAAALAGFVAPTLVASLILRNPEDIEQSSDKHQLTPGALYVPIFSALVIAGLTYQDFCRAKRRKSTVESVVSETTSLMQSADKKGARASIVQISDTFSRSSEVSRRMSVECMEIPNPVDTKYERELSAKLLKDKEDWEEIERIYNLEE